MCNTDVREEAKRAGIRLWQVAEKLGINDGNFSRKLRRELPPEEKRKIFEIIKSLKEGEKNAATHANHRASNYRT